MNAWVDSSLAMIAAHPHWAGLFVFTVAASEAIVLVGYLIPGTLILLGVGGIAGLGHLPLVPILVWAAAGAIAGDGFSYWLGHRYRESLRDRWPFTRYPDLMNRGEAFFHRHGGKSVVIGRFVPVLKPIIPVVAGIVGMQPIRFYSVNVFSALLWAPVHILPGVLTGASLKLLHGVSPRLALVAFVIIVALGSILWLTRFVVLRTAPVVRGLFYQFYNWSQQRAGSLVQRLAQRFDPAHPATTALLVTLLLLLGAFTGFIAVLEDVVNQETLVRADHAINMLVQQIRNPWTDPFLITITNLGDAPVSAAITLTLLAWLLIRKRWNLALATAAVVVLPIAGVSLLKLTVHVPRPATMYSGFDAFSFPSGHTAVTAALYGLIAWMIAGGLRLRSRPYIYAGALSWILLMAASRVYLGAHWPSDVIAGLCLGLLGPLAVAALYHGYPRARIRPGMMTLILALVLLLTGTWHVARSWDKAVNRYVPVHATQPLDVMAWRQGTELLLPNRRIDLGGEQKEPLVLQWLGSPGSLARQLAVAGWSAPPVWDVSNATAFLRPDSPIARLPVLPRLHNGQTPLLTLIRPVDNDPNSRWILRAWQSGYIDSANSTPLLLASLTQETALHPAQLLTLVHSTPTSPDAVAHILEIIHPIESGRIAVENEDMHGNFPILP